MAHSKKRGKAVSEESAPDFELVFKADGSVELRDSAKTVVWSSDSDDDFAEEFDGDFFSDEDDSDDILDYLDEQGHIDLESDEIDIVENDLQDEADDDDIIDGEFTVRS